MSIDPREFLAESPWVRALGDEARAQVMHSTRYRCVERNQPIAVMGTPARHWFGVVDGFAVQSASCADGRTAYLSAVSHGAWFGEGTLMKNEAWSFDALALRKTTLALVPLELFEKLRASSIAFNHFLEGLMNRRLAQLSEKLLSFLSESVEGRIVRTIIDLHDPRVHKRQDPNLRIRQTEIALLAGTSRPRANMAISRLQTLGLIEASKGIRILDLDGLRKLADTHRCPPPGRSPCGC